MSIPVEAVDSDIMLTDALRHVPALIRRVREAEAKVARVEAVLAPRNTFGIPKTSGLDEVRDALRGES